MIGGNKMFVGFSETSMNLGLISLTFLLKNHANRWRFEDLWARIQPMRSLGEGNSLWEVSEKPVVSSAKYMVWVWVVMDKFGSFVVDGYRFWILVLVVSFHTLYYRDTCVNLSSTCVIRF